MKSRLGGLLVLASIGAVTIAASAAVGLATAGAITPVVPTVASLTAAAGVNLVVFLASSRVLTAAPVTTRQVLPGAALAVCWLLLKALGGIYVIKVLEGSSQTYGGFAAVVGLLTWLLIRQRSR